MADFLNIGTTALLSLQQAISTTGHNIANVNTEGYSRQTANFSTLPPQYYGGNYLGSGAAVSSIERAYDQFLSSELRSRTSAQAGQQAFYELSSRLDNLLADPAVGLSPALDGFFSAVQDVANNPGSMPERQVMLGEANVLADRFHYLDANFRSLDADLNSRIDVSVAEVNGLANSIADLNAQVVSATARAGGQPPNDLLDARDEAIRQLSEKVGVTTVAQSDGSINVMIGNGQPLVVGTNAEQLQAVRDPYDSGKVIVGRENAAGVFTDLSRFLGGGELGAVIDFRTQVLNPARNELGLLATGIADTFNQQHQLGLDINGQPGGEFFLPLQAATGAHSLNSGSSSVSAVIDDATALTGDDYSLRFDGAQWTLTNLTTQSSQTGPGPFTMEGLTVDVTGAPANGDSFKIEPTRQGAALFSVVLQQPEQIAAASPLRSSQSLSNVGSGEIADVLVTDTSGLPLASPVTLSFNPDALGAGVPGFDVVGAPFGPLAYDPATESNGKTFSLGGYEVTVAGNPAPGDELLVENNSNGSGDNRNALALAGLQTSRTLLGGTASYQETYGTLVADIAVQTRQAETASATESILLGQAESARQSVSGVNLDEEAANLIRYQQAYQAAAQMVAVADQLFQSLLNATGR